MKKSVLSQWFVVLCLFSAFVWWASGSIREASAMGKGKSAPASDSTDVDAIKQIGQDMGNAMIAGDIAKLNQIFADDWATAVVVIGRVTESARPAAKNNVRHLTDKLSCFIFDPIPLLVGESRRLPLG